MADKIVPSVHLNSGVPVGDELFARRQIEVRDRLVAKIRDELDSSELVEAVWLIGSLGRGDEDALSDIDLVVVASEGGNDALVRSLPVVVARFGDIALANHAPWNAPVGGYQLNVLYDVDPLPIFCDWSVWPLQPKRPADAAVLFERDPGHFKTEGTFDAILADAPKENRNPIDGLNASARLFMVPVIAKEAARGWFPSVEAMRQYLPFPVRPMSSLEDALGELRRVVTEHTDEEPAAAVRGVLRYLSGIEQLV